MEKTIIKESGSVYGHKDAWVVLNEVTSSMEPTSIFILTDSNTNEHCLPYFLANFQSDKTPTVLTIQSGEEYKTIPTCLHLWEQLSSLGADRKSLLINLGGGVITDLGGFVACTFQRGISFINIPTSLLAMVDAAVGGKNGVDLGSLKNQVGIIKNAEAVIIDTSFLDTLPSAEFNSGMSEMLKHGFITSKDYLEKIMNMEPENKKEVTNLIWESIEIKNRVITEDPTEKGIRKTLNYGHTLGHAIESYCLQSHEKQTLLHGEAIAIGMILATYISMELFQFPKNTLLQTTTFILKHFKKVHFSETEIEHIIKLLLFDKKNTNGTIQFVLLSAIGNHKLNCIVPNDLIYRAFKFYNNF